MGLLSCGRKVKWTQRSGLNNTVNQLATIYEFDLLCAYPLSSFHNEEEDEHVFQSICAEHSPAVDSR